MGIETFNAWSSIYEQSIGGVTRQLARHILSIMPPFTPSSVVLDNAAGWGIVTSEILKLGPPTDAVLIHAVDVSNAMAAVGSSLFASHPNVTYAVMAGESLDFPDETFTHSVINIGILVFADGQNGARGIYRTVEE